MDRNKAAREIAAAYDAVSSQLETAMNRLSAANYSQAGAIELRKTTGRLVDRLNQAAKKWTSSRILGAYKDQKSVTITRLEIIGVSRRVAVKERLTGQKVRDLALEDFLKANLTIEKTVDQYILIIGRAAQRIQESPKRLQAFVWPAKTEAAIEDLITEALESGLNEGTLSRQIADLLRSKATGGKYIEIGDRSYSLAAYSELVARARLSDAMSQGTKDAAQEYDHDLVEIPESQDPCDECAEIQGQIYSISGNDPDYEPLTDENTPPLHPNCRHYLRVVPMAAGERRRA